MPDQVPKAVVQERYDRLIALQEQISWEENRALQGRTVEVLVSEGEGRKDAATHRLSGRARDNRLVHFALPAGVSGPDADAGPVAGQERDPRHPRPGDVVTVAVTYGAPHHLVADSALTGGVYQVRRTAAGDAWERREAARRAGEAVSAIPAVRVPVGLGMPSLRRG